MNFRREIQRALREDQAWQDVTTKTFVSPRLRATACVVSHSEGILAGVEPAALAFRMRDRRCRVKILVRDGKPILNGTVLMSVDGPLASILSVERTALNVLSHLSGVATLTHRFVKAAGKNRLKILDTRKTLPGLRALQKWAVRCGGGQNHRFDLAEAVLIKENHLSVVRDEKALGAFFRRIKKMQKRGLSVEMECENQNEVVWGILSGADILMLDNFSPARLPKITRWIRRFCSDKKIRCPLLEVSGGITLGNIPAILRAGVDRVSIGQITHSAPALDMSLDVHVKNPLR